MGQFPKWIVIVAVVLAILLVASKYIVKTPQGTFQIALFEDKTAISTASCNAKEYFSAELFNGVATNLCTSFCKAPNKNEQFKRWECNADSFIVCVCQ
jgi:hypothetical protein